MAVFICNQPFFPAGAAWLRMSCVPAVLSRKTPELQRLFFVGEPCLYFWGMTKLIKNLALLAYAAVAVSCGDENDLWLDSGSLTGTNLRVIQIDTFQTTMSSFRYDSIVNDSENRLLVGRYSDPVFGTVTASAFMEVVPTAFAVNDDAVFDSIVLNLAYDGYYYNDTLATQHLKIHKLAQVITLDNGADDYYNTTDFAVFPDVIGEKAFLPRISRDSLTVKLSDDFGQQLFDKLQNSVINNVEELRDHFKGIRLSLSDTDDAAVIGYDASSTYIRMYYSYEGSDDTGYLDFKRNNIDEVKKYANHISSDRTNTPVASLNGQETELGSQSAQGLAFLQSGIGITTKITFPTIRSIREINDNQGKIMKANFRMRVNPAYYNENLYAVDSMYICIVDQNNDIISQLKDGTGNEVMAYLDRENPEFNEVYITASVGPFIEKVLSDAQYLQYGLVLFPVKYNSSVGRMVINGPSGSNPSKLELTYAIYK